VTQAGMVTFGSLSHFCKVNDEVMRLWCKALVAVENSRLLLLAPQGRHRGRLADLAERSGVDPSRIVFVSPRPRIDYLKLYWQIDIGLDPFPYNGITTTCDAMWMGVPVVTLKGLRAAARAGLSLLSNVGLPELVADSQEQYVQIVRDLARDRDRLQLLHASLRQRMLESPLMNARQFAAQVESAFRGFPAQF
jgi:predicted O-linked N-acetylglucosamine transferase (SPINDLY family)